MNPTLYDVLGVTRGASAEAIKQAWKVSAERFEPGSGGSTAQFRLFNEAAEVLLDPKRRKAYDEELDAQEARGRPQQETADDNGASHNGAGGATVHDVGASSSDAAGSSSDEGRGVRWVVLAVLAVLAAAAVGLAAYFALEARAASRYQEAVVRAPAAAERAAAAVLSYGHETLDADRDAAARFLTPDYRKEYVETFDKLVKESATETKATVEAEVLASSVMTSAQQRDPEELRVLLFVNQTTTSSGTSEPSVALNRVRLDMVQVDGTWFVDGITSY